MIDHFFARLGVGAVAALAVFTGIPGGSAQESLPVLARVAPWPVVSRLIGYGDDLWFANSVKGRNHNAADLYTYDPDTDEVRYERNLLSQDAGRPLVAHGHLYWPFEDARVSMGVGHYMVTDGDRWQLGTVPGERTFHTHAMAAIDGSLLAATSAWRARVQVSSDAGASWRRIYEQPTPEGQVTRIVELTTLDARVFGYLTSRQQRGLLEFDGDQVGPVPDWPQQQPVFGLARRGDHLYGAVKEPDGISIWRTDGVASAPMTTPDPAWAVRALVGDDGGLWALTATEAGGTVWFSEDGRSWQARHSLTGGRPFELTRHRGALYVGGAGTDGRGILRGTAPARAMPGPAPRPLAARPSSPRAIDWAEAGRQLDQALADPDSYQRHGGDLRTLVLRLATSAPPSGFFGERLVALMPDDAVPLIGGAVTVPAAKLGRWVLLWGMSMAGQGRVPPAWIGAPWTASPNRAEKYFETAPGAIWTAAIVGQRDRATIDALIARLETPGDPDWLTGDVIGALATLTDQRFAYDGDAWRRWWTGARAGWTGGG